MDEITFMQTPDQWPKWPVLPLVRRGGHWNDKGHCGYLLNNELRGPHKDPVVWIGYIWMASTKDEKLAYASFEELAKEWRVD